VVCNLAGKKMAPGPMPNIVLEDVEGWISRLSTDGVITLFANMGGGAFTASGTKGIRPGHSARHLGYMKPRMVLNGSANRAG
jgi:hypothetical protein